MSVSIMSVSIMSVSIMSVSIMPASIVFVATMSAATMSVSGLYKISAENIGLIPIPLSKFCYEYAFMASDHRKNDE